MLSPIAFDLIIKYFDAVDRTVAAFLNGIRPWGETALTFLLCGLLDEKKQEILNLPYTLRQLNEELSAFDSLEIHVTLETHEYPPNIERWVTQSDLGFVVNFNNLMIPSDSWTASWLLQAKRLYPTSNNPMQYDETSQFGAANSAQHARIKKLIDATGVSFIKYLLYCPRVESLDHVTRQKIRHLHNRSLGAHIYDYTPGFQLYKERLKVDNSLGAGLLIADPSYLSKPNTFGVAHSGMLKPIKLPVPSPIMLPFWPSIESYFWPLITPLAWFLTLQLMGEHPDIDQSNSDWVHGIVSGDLEAVERVLKLFNNDNEQAPGPFLPPHTLTIGVYVGHDLDPERRQIRLE